jgi:hypothetical protein
LTFLPSAEKGEHASSAAEVLEEADVLPLLRQPSGDDALIPGVQVHGFHHRAAAAIMVHHFCS